MDDDAGGRAPYGRPAEFYDELLGITAFECFRENFERLSARYGITFDVCADVACGTGLAVLYLSGSCSRVYAVDSSARMRRAARRKVV